MTIGSILGLIVFGALMAIALRKLSTMDNGKIVNQFRRDAYIPDRKNYENDSKGSGE